MKKILAVTKTKLKLYWPLTKSLQTGLLLSTGLAGFMTARCPVIHWYDFFNLTLSLFMAIAGSTILNMWYDRDIDARMARTCARPLPTGQVSPQEALRLGLILSIAGIGMAVLMKPLYGLLVSAGLFFDVIVYTFWLKRRSEWSIVLGGFSGAMPILAGRAFGMDRVDMVGIILFLAVLFWIPTHILTFAMRNAEDYRAAGIPTFVSKYGQKTARAIIAVSSLIASQAIAAAGIMIGIQWGFIGFLGVLSAGLLILAITSVLRPSERTNFSLFKYASVYMLAAMVLLAL